MPSTHQSIVIKAPIDDVWNRFSNFHDLAWASNVIKTNQAIGGVRGDEVGAKRILNDVFHETLVECRPESYYLKYSIDDGPSPVSCDEVSNYFGVVQLTRLPGDEGTQVEWSSSWDSNSKDAVEFCHKIYLALLSDLSSYYQ